ncbi:MAG: trypsin-like peptidase domain-containing protein [Sphingobacteriales bacterium]|nr:trypsin-like peptidase domain-containing protein [Sphingobacteriales bacterium]
MKTRQILFTVIISAVTTVTSLYLFNKWNASKYSVVNSQGKLPVNYAGYDGGGAAGQPADFQSAAQKSVPAVVHIKTKTNPKQVSNNSSNQRNNPFKDLFGDNNDFFDQFFGDGNRQRVIPGQMASGSGVLISDNGYIITNNHVIADADEISVTLSNKKTYTGKVVGTDPSTDLAVVKINATNLPYMLYGNSDDVRIGQWVLAVGYPLNLETTVTAGIVSAKARTLEINARQSKFPIESFIQTDAAVNQGNSGGALVNTDGALIGINSAIASPTGFYSGYSYAIPVNIVKKIVNDIMQYGTVQRAYLGISYPRESLNDDEKKKLGIVDGEGVYVLDVVTDGSAAAAGIKKGDIITKMNDANITSAAELQEQLARYKPGDKLNVGYKRNGKDYAVAVTLKNKVGNFELVKNDEANILDNLGADIETLDKTKAKANGVNGGVVVKKLKKGGWLGDQSFMRDGFIILRVDGKEVKSMEELNTAITKADKGFTIEGIYPGSDSVYEYTIQKTDGDE